jgi:long-chain acyl-CoA synthetase
MNVADTLLSRGKDSAPAVLFRDNALCFSRLRDEVCRCAAYLASRGHTQGERIGIVAENSPFFVIAYLSVIRAGAVAVPFPTDLTESFFASLVSDAGIKTLFVSNHYLGRIRRWAEKRLLTILSERNLTDYAGPAETPMPSIDTSRDLAALLFTSGSSGAPKGVMLTHRNIECNTLDIVSYLNLTRDDRAMVVLPFHYCFGLSLLHTHLFAGASTVLNNDFRLFPESMLLEMEERGCTGFAGVPSTYQILLRKSRFRELKLPKLRWFQQAGGKLPDACIREVIAAFPHVAFYLMYGQTEGTARLSYLPPDRLRDKLGSIGKGLPSTRLEVIRPDGTPVIAGSNETGEIVATGDNIAAGYWNDPESTARSFQQGRLHTGDIARVDADGFIYIVGREKEIIKSGGNRVSAKEVEEVIAEMEEILEVAVVGMPHELLGEAIKAYVVPASHAAITPREVEIHCRKRLPAFKSPEEVIFLDALPHNAGGKILKNRLKEMAQTPQAVNRGNQPFSVAEPSLT